MDSLKHTSKGSNGRSVETISSLPLRSIDAQARDNTTMALADRLKQCREERGWKKSELRRRAGLRSPSTLSELESGTTTDSYQMEDIALALGVEVAWLKHGRGPKYRGEKNPALEMSTNALDAARIVDQLPMPLQNKALVQLNAMLEMHRIDEEISERKKAIRAAKKEEQGDHDPD